MAKHMRDNWYRDVWLFLITVAVVVGFISIIEATQQIEHGRRDTSGITCAVTSATVHAGKLVITSSAQQPLPLELEAFLEKHGLPSRKTREASAETAANSYTALINDAIVKTAGVKATKVLEPERLPNGAPNPNAGLLNCERLRQLARIKR
jgi:hypothetical protein